MEEWRLGAIEGRFADLVWDSAPISSGDLVKLCRQELNWKKSTTYTMLRRLCQRGIFQNSGGVVTALLSREEFQGMQSRQFVEETFAGSLPKFLTAFSRGEKLSDREIEELQKLIDEMRG